MTNLILVTFTNKLLVYNFNQFKIGQYLIFVKYPCMICHVASGKMCHKLKSFCGEESEISEPYPNQLSPLVRLSQE